MSLYFTFRKLYLVFAVLIFDSVSTVRAEPAPKGLIPKDAKLVFEQVIAAVESDDLMRLKALMVEDFTWSFGGDRSSQQALDEWKKDPSSIKRLPALLKSSCKLENSHTIVCESDSRQNLRAGFSRKPVGWLLEYFVAGD